MYLLLILMLLLVLILVTYGSKFLKRWVRVLLGLYYAIISFIFIYGRHQIHEKYNMYDGPVIDEGWGVNANWASVFSFLYLIPLLILLIYLGMKGFKFSSGKRGQQILLVFFVSFLLLLPFYIFFNLIYGMRP